VIRRVKANYDFLLDNACEPDGDRSINQRCLWWSLSFLTTFGLALYGGRLKMERPDLLCWLESVYRKRVVPEKIAIPDDLSEGGTSEYPCDPNHGAF
jgi:hypothetical protein